jgi:hypothetical protein
MEAGENMSSLTRVIAKFEGLLFFDLELPDEELRRMAREESTGAAVSSSSESATALSA